MNYQSWYSMDLYPYREDAREAISESISWLKKLETLLDNYSMEKMRVLIEQGNATTTVREVRRLMLGD
jgi:hypothetical protein